MTPEDQKHVLVIDDASLVRAYYRQALEKVGYHVDEAMNGLEGLEKLLMQHFDVVIVDVNMPQMDGMTFLSTLRSKELPLAGTPVLVTSTEAGEQDVDAARRAGANYYLVKPISQDALANCIDLLAGVAR